jgi:hypothetical protein
MGNGNSAESATKVASETASKEMVERIVDGFMKNKKVNSAMIPDVVERAIYENVLTLVLGVLEEVAASASIEVLGHRIEMKLVPDAVKSL